MPLFFFISHLTFRYSGCSSCSHTWDAFQLAHASFRLYCVRNNYVQSVKLGPRLLGDAPKINIIPAENDVDEEEGCSEAFLAIKIYDEDVNMKFLVCGVPCTLVSLEVMPHSSVVQSFSCFQSMIAQLYRLQDACLLGALEDGLNALLNIEVCAHFLVIKIR